MTKQRALYIGGEWMSGYGKAITSVNPATGKSIYKADGASQSDVGRAVKSAKRQSSFWKNTSLDDRKQILMAFAECLKSKQSELTEAISQETGKPLWDAKTEVQASINKISLSIQAF